MAGGHPGEIWKLEDNLYPFLELVVQVLSDRPLFILVNSYTTGLAPGVLTYLLDTLVTRRYGGHTDSQELGLPVTASGLALPCGATGQLDGGTVRKKEWIGVEAKAEKKNIIEIEHVTFSYAGEEGEQPVEVLKDVSLEIETGSFVAVLGHNGCGKSTLAKHMNAILLPSGGTDYVDGIDTRNDEQWLDVQANGWDGVSESG